MTTTQAVTYPNGKIPLSLLKKVSNFVPLKSNVSSAVGSDLLRQDAADAMVMLQVAFLKKFGRSLNISEAYRSRELQDYYWDLYLRGIGNLAAVPGTSNHGLGLSVDFGSGISIAGSVAKVWMDENAPSYGWVPTGNKFPKVEPWHYDFFPNTATVVIPSSGGATPFPTNPTTPTTPDFEDDMFSDSDRTLLTQVRDLLAKDVVASEAGGIRGALDRAYVRELRPSPDAQHRLVQLKGQLEVFHSVNFEVLRWLRTEKDLADVGWQLQQINALNGGSIRSQVITVDTLAPFGTLLGARPILNGAPNPAYTNL